MCTCVGFKSMSMRVYMCANDLCVCVRHPACVRAPVYVHVFINVCSHVCVFVCVSVCVCMGECGCVHMFMCNIVI